MKSLKNLSEKNKERQQGYNYYDNSDFMDKSDITTSNFEVATEIEEKNDFEEYKNEIDKILEQKKEKLKMAFTANKSDFEEKIKKEFAEKLEKEIEEEKKKYEKIYQQEKDRLERENKSKVEKQKKQIEENLVKEYKMKNDKIKSENDEKIDNLNDEIRKLESELRKLEMEENNFNDEYEIDYDKEIDKYKKDAEIDLKNFQNQLDLELSNKQNELNELYELKKIEFEKNFMKAQQEENKEEIEKKLDEQENYLQSQKNMLNKMKEAKLERYKNQLLQEYYKNTEKEKKEIMQNFESEVNMVKNNYEQMKSFYEQQKLIVQSEQAVSNASNLIEKMKNIINNKSAVFKNLIEQNHFILKKKLKECENIHEIDNFSNRETILAKITELLNTVFYANIYEILYNDMKDEKEMISKFLDGLIKNCEGIISTFNSDKKIQLGLYICNPNFN